MTDPAKPVSRSWRRFLRFSVRGLIVVVLVIGGWVGWIVRSAQIQREAVAAIANAGGIVSYDWEWYDGKPKPGRKPWAPQWLVDLIGVNYFGHITEVWIFREKVSNETNVQIGKLKRLQRLFLRGCSIDDAELAHLTGLSRLDKLSLADNPVTDAGLVHLKALTNLSTLWLTETQVSDAGLVHLKALTNLSTLGLRDTQVTDAGVKDLQQALPRLKIIR